MSDHFAAFSFVDRITEFEPGDARARPVRGARATSPRSRRASSPKPSASSRRGSRWRTSAFAAGRWRRSRTKRASARDVAPGEHARARRRHRELRRRRGRLRRLGAGRRQASRSSSSIASARCCRSRSSIRPTRCASASSCCAARGAPPGRFRGVAAAARRRVDAAMPGESLRRDAARARVARRSSAITSRAVRCFRRRCCSTRRSASRSSSRPRRRTGAAATRPAPSRMTHVKMRAFIPPGARARHRRRARADGRRTSRRSSCSARMRRQDRRDRAARTSRVEPTSGGCA